MNIKKKLSECFLSLAKKIDKNTVEDCTTYIGNDTAPIIYYDIDRFEFIVARIEESQRWIETMKSSGIDYHSEVNHQLARAIGAEILKRHKDDINEHIVWDGNNPTDKVSFSLKLLVEKSKEENK